MFKVNKKIVLTLENVLSRFTRGFDATLFRETLDIFDSNNLDIDTKISLMLPLRVKQNNV